MMHDEYLCKDKKFFSKNIQHLTLKHENIFIIIA